MAINLRESIDSFLTQSRRVIAITHKPGQAEYRQMSLTTAIGMVIIGVLGFIVAMVALFLKGSF